VLKVDNEAGWPGEHAYLKWNLSAEAYDPVEYSLEVTRRFGLGDNRGVGING
jgi:hypothetical protein